MAQYKVSDGRKLNQKIINEMSRKIEGFKEEFLRELAASIVLDSPVDTGTYMENHNVGTNPKSGSDSSRGKPRNQNYGTYANQALSNLYSQIDGVANDDLDTIYFYNTAEHAITVEYEHGYEPYSRAKAKAPQMASEAAAKVKAKTT